MGIKIVMNGHVMDSGVSPTEETAQNSDGRTLIPYTAAIYHQDGAVDTITDRAFDPAIKLPPSGNISKVYPGNKATESDSSGYKVNPAAISNPDLYRDQARVNNAADIAAQQRIMGDEIRQATTLTPVGYDLTGRVGAWQVKRSQ